MRACLGLLLGVVACTGGASGTGPHSMTRPVEPSNIPIAIHPDPALPGHTCEKHWGHLAAAKPPGSEPRLTCGPEVLAPCTYVLHTAAPNSAETEHALAVLEAGCRKDRVCGCAFLGSGLTSLPRDSDQARGVEHLAASCRAGSDPACQFLRRVVENCSRERGSQKRGACAEAVRQGLLVETPIEISEVLGCWRLEAAHYEAVCIEQQRLLLRGRNGAWTLFPFHRWSSSGHEVLSGMVPGGMHLWPRLAIQAYQGTKGRGLRLTLRTRREPWLYLVPLGASDQARLTEESRKVANEQRLRSW